MRCVECATEEKLYLPWRALWRSLKDILSSALQDTWRCTQVSCSICSHMRVLQGGWVSADDFQPPLLNIKQQSNWHAVVECWTKSEVLMSHTSKMHCIWKYLECARMRPLLEPDPGFSLLSLEKYQVCANTVQFGKKRLLLLKGRLQKDTIPGKINCSHILCSRTFLSTY